MNASNIKKPKTEIRDVTYTIVKAFISSLSFIGGPAAEHFSAIIVPPLSKRRDEWIESIAKGLENIKERVEEFNIESLSQNDAFITMLINASQSAIRNHQKEKLEALRNAVMNSALHKCPEEDIQIMFLHFIDFFTPWHLRILKFLNDPQEWGYKNNIKYPDLYSGSISDILEYSFPELKGRRAFYDQIVKDLFDRGLININFLHTMMSAAGIFVSRTTEMGKEFINFILSPIDNID